MENRAVNVPLLWMPCMHEKLFISAVFMLVYRSSGRCTYDAKSAHIVFVQMTQIYVVGIANKTIYSESFYDFAFFINHRSL